MGCNCIAVFLSHNQLWKLWNQEAFSCRSKCPVVHCISKRWRISVQYKGVQFVKYRLFFLDLPMEHCGLRPKTGNGYRLGDRDDYYSISYTMLIT